jgi:hypothetical protein
MAVATFARAGLRPLRVGRDQGCDCNQALGERWRRLWACTLKESLDDMSAGT